MLRRLEQVAPLLLWLPSLTLAYFIHTFGVNVPIHDDWTLVETAASRPFSSWSSLTGQLNEHVILFPRLLMLGVAALTRHNTVALVFTSWLLLCLTGAILLRRHQRRSAGQEAAPSLLLFVPISFLLFNLAQWEGGVWASCLPIYFANFAVVAAVICLERSQGVDRWLASALASGAVASFSFATGILVWPLGLLQLMLRPAPHRRRSLAVWVAGAALALGLFWARYRPLPEAGQPVGPGRALAFVAGLWGSPFSESLAVAAGVGGVALVCAIALLVLARKQRLLADNTAAVALLAFGVLSAIMIMKGRAGLAATYAVQSRYTPIVAIGWIGLYLLAVEVLGARSGALALGARRLVAVLVIAGVAHASVAGWKHGVTDRMWRSHSASILADYRLQRDEVLAAFLHRDVALVRRLATFLESNRLSVFAAPDRQGDQ